MNTVKPINTQQIIKFNALLRELLLGEDIKRDLIYQFTKGRSDRTNDMHYEEARMMISHLEDQKSPSLAKKQQDADAGQRMRRKIISIAHQLGWTDLKTGKVDMNRLNSFLVQRGAVRGPKIKTINDYNNRDLSVIVTQFQQMLKHHLNQFK